MILGGYGAFGHRIAKLLACKGYPLVLVGRNKDQADAMIDELQNTHLDGDFRAMCFDVNTDLIGALEKAQPRVLIHSCGPFQDQGFHVLEACIHTKTHYIDLADGRAFVHGIQRFHEQAMAAGITAVTGASTVPALSSAVLSHFMEGGMVAFDEIKYGISPGQKTDRGLATAQSVLSYVGQPIECKGKCVYGWQNTYLQKYPGIHSRLIGNCEIPDIDVLPAHFPIRKLMFSAGMESKLLHLGIWFCSWLVRAGLPLNLEKHAEFWMKFSRYFDVFGTDDGGMHVLAKGTNTQGETCEMSWFIVAKNGDGPYIPTIPSVILADRLMGKNSLHKGVKPCVSLISLNEYLDELSSFDVTTH